MIEALLNKSGIHLSQNLSVNVRARCPVYAYVHEIFHLSLFQSLVQDALLVCIESDHRSANSQSAPLYSYPSILCFVGIDESVLEKLRSDRSAKL